MSGADNADVVEFWRSVELFDPQTAPDHRRAGPSEPPKVFDLPMTGPLPWQTGHEAQRWDPGDKREWQYTVYAGLFEMQRTQDEIARVLGPGKPGEERGSAGETAMFAFAVGADGFLVGDSAVLSSSAWAVGRLRVPGPDAANWLDGFDDEEKDFTRALNRLALPAGGGGTAAPAADGGRGPEPRAPQDAGSATHRVLRAAGRHVTGAATEAVNEGARTAGGMVTGVAAATVTGVAGPFAGAYAGSVAGKFVEKLLTIDRGETTDPPATRPEGNETAGQPSGEPPGMTMTIEYLVGFVRDLARALHIEESLGPSGIRVELKSVPIREDKEKRPGSAPMLNSFIREDLSRIARALRDGDAGPALRHYLTPDAGIDVRARTDTGKDRLAVLDAVAPAARPSGRWPVARENSLSVGQQLAVDRIMTDLADGAGTSTVNGPPGTGKTTLLRDVVAAVVVRRAERLAGLSGPNEAFVDKVSYEESGSTWRVPTLKSELTGSEMVLATNSNKAAENVTLELPLASGSDLERLRRVDFFPDIAEQLIKDFDGKPMEKSAWALTSAALGNFNNRRKFNDVFWWPDSSEPVPGLLARLAQAVEDPEPFRDEWTSAVREFRASRRRVDELTAERQRAAEAVSRRASYPARRAELIEREQAGRAQLAEHEIGVRDAERTHDVSRDRLAGAEADVVAHESNPPGWWARLTTFGRASRDWSAERRELVARKRAAVADEVAAAERRRVYQDAVATAQAVLTAVCRDLDELDQGETQDARIIDDALLRWPNNLPTDPSDLDFDRSSPWADEDIEIARATVCEAALRLHRAFVLTAAKQIRPALIAANKIIGGARLGRAVARAAWQAFFFVVPVVSTTFASLPRLFADLEREDLGWLLVDEAGQATQQSVVGGMWRARRAVLVGDPMQLEPIVPLPERAQIALADRYGVDQQWMPERRSAQVAADRLTRFGTSKRQPESDELIWVGAPLRVHRRCDRPMFDIANDVAYADSPMVFATKERPSQTWRPSQWIDVRGRVSDKVVHAEIDQLSRLVSELLSAGCPRADILVIAPFRAVVRAAQGRLREQLDTKTNVGTVHTVQGKEARVVILVLGGSPWGRDWAASRPNLLNVAVSRAQERFYVIGDHADWKRRRFFSVAARRLDLWTPPA